ncbi:MAG TPA: hypothetical protein DCG34_00160 [Clostridiales bacterium]|jgi:GntR family transcriptional repressor for pyruvate dehydrogenase complex|nr:hypothetical protein [Clostridiales bacterium]
MAIKNTEFDSHIQPVERHRVYEKISEQINSMILDGILKPGDQLPPERELAERFKVSRNSVRDALRTLEARGLLEIRQGGGTYVQATKAADLYQNMLEVMVQKKEMTGAVLQLRLIIEPGVAYNAAINSSQKYLVKLEDILAKHEEKASQGDPGVEEDSLFHKTIAEMTGNKLLIHLLDMVNESLEETRDLLLKYNEGSIRKGHRKILEALQERNPEKARDAMMDHLMEVIDTYEFVELKNE